MIHKSTFEFLNTLIRNNNRPWFNKNKDWYETSKSNALEIFSEIHQRLTSLDEFHDMKMYRIYRDTRFSKDKSPYKEHFSAIFKRKQPQNRGSFYVQIKPNECLVGGGFWGPEKKDLHRIRKAIEIEDDLEQIIHNPSFIKHFGTLQGEKLKNVPKDFDRDHPRGEFLKYKQFLIIKNYKDQAIFKNDFIDQVIEDYQTMQPFFRYMTEVLTTNENGESLL